MVQTHWVRDELIKAHPGLEISIEAMATQGDKILDVALAKIGAEYVLRWVPAGTHDWSQFLKPEEIRRMLGEEPVAVSGPFGLVYDPFTDRWSESDDVGINYMMVATRD